MSENRIGETNIISGISVLGQNHCGSSQRELVELTHKQSFLLDVYIDLYSVVLRSCVWV